MTNMKIVREKRVNIIKVRRKPKQTKKMQEKTREKKLKYVQPIHQDFITSTIHQHCAILFKDISLGNW